MGKEIERLSFPGLIFSAISERLIERAFDRVGSISVIRLRQSVPQGIPVNGCQRPLEDRWHVYAAFHEGYHLFAVIEPQLDLSASGGALRVILHQNPRRQAHHPVFQVERHLVRTQPDLASPAHHLQLHHHETPVRDRDQAVRQA